MPIDAKKIDTRRGGPAQSLFPKSEIKEILQKEDFWQNDFAGYLGGEQGLLSSREVIGKEVGVDPKNLILGSGSMSLFQSLLKGIINENKRTSSHKVVVFVPNITYDRALLNLQEASFYKSHNGDSLKIVGIKGAFNLENLKDEVHKYPSDMFSKFLYVIPDFGNPTGYLLNKKEREVLLKISDFNEIMIIEDNPYMNFVYEGDPIPSLFELSGFNLDRVITLGSFSKACSMAALRVAYMGVPDYLKQYVLNNLKLNISSNPQGHILVSEIIQKGLLKKIVKDAVDFYKPLMNKWIEGLNQVKGLEFTAPKGGFFIWCEIVYPDWNFEKLEVEARKKDLLLGAGESFFVDKNFKSTKTFRIAIPNVPEPQKAIDILYSILSQ